MTPRAEGSPRRASRAPARPVADGSRLRWPGAAGGFALFGEALWVGVLVTVVGLPLLTLPAALAAGVRSLRRYLRAERSGLAEFWGDVRAAALGGLVVALAVLGALGLLSASAFVAATSPIPGRELVLVVCALAAVAVVTSLVALAAQWRPALGWRGAASTLRSSVAGDASGAVLLVVAVGLTGVAAWQLPPLIVPALGCLAFAAAVVVERRHAREHPLADNPR
ncbi:hypothetical protein [Microcella sp.]|uniref:hypothetical protein n=1 Tax=Microcella sp. TaxID=1913979 RepID=UPI00256288F1|nr:hypothetical protein [Microcella sp.]MBX9472503.1 hypothetical protein [Microcella sp.]